MFVTAGVKTNALYTLLMTTPNLPVFISTPHSSGFVPFYLLAEMLGDAVFNKEARETRLSRLFAEGDPYTDAIFYAPGANHLNAVVSRFVVDANRARNFGGPNGVIKLTDFSERLLYPEGFALSAAAAEQRLRRYWDSYHAAVAESLSRNNILFFVDGHSMTPHGPAISPDKDELRPAISLVTGGDKGGQPQADGVHTSISASLAQKLRDLLKRHFHDIICQSPGVPNEITLNTPFDRGEVIMQHSNPLRPGRKPGFAIEFNRALYLEPAESGRPLAGRVEALQHSFATFLEAAVPVVAAELQSIKG